MKHKKWIRSIHLLRKDELDHQEQKALDTHLSQCEDCKAIYEQLQMDWVSVVGELGIAPELPNPGYFTSTILNQVQFSSSGTKTQAARNSFDLLEWIFNPRFRVGIQLATLSLLAIFLVEQLQITHSIRNLEQQLSSQSMGTHQASLSLLPQSAKMRAMVALKKQLEKRGLPSKRIDKAIKKRDAQMSARELIRTELQGSGLWKDRIIKRMKPGH